MSLPPKWRGFEQTHEVPGGYCVARRITITGAATFAKIDMRAAAWFGACPWLADPSSGELRGILKRLVVRFVPSTEDASTTGTALYIADKDASGGDNYNAITATSGTFERTYPTQAELTGFWRRAVGGNVVIDVEAFYDVPPAVT